MDVTAVAQMALNLQADSPATRVKPVADDLVAAQFSEIMNPQAATPLQKSASAVAPDDPPPTRTMGSAILDGMQKLSHEFQETRRAVHASLDAGTQMTMADALRLQMSLVELSIQHEMVGKTISRSTQNIDQLVKMQ